MYPKALNCNTTYAMVLLIFLSIIIQFSVFRLTKLAEFNNARLYYHEINSTSQAAALPIARSRSNVIVEEEHAENHYKSLPFKLPIGRNVTSNVKIDGKNVEVNETIAIDKSHTAKKKIRKHKSYLNAEEDKIKNNDGIKKKPVSIVAYHVTITKCSERDVGMFHDLMAVLKHSIEIMSYPLHPTSKYGTKFYGIIPPFEKGKFYRPCLETLENLNFTVRRLKMPVKLHSINKGKVYSEIEKDGCCGIYELMKLHVYTIDPNVHPISINLDLDMLLLKPLDILFDALTYLPGTAEGRRARERILNEKLIAPTYYDYGDQKNKETILSKTFDSFHTRDYNMLKSFQGHRAGLQGGLLMVRPNKTTFNGLVDIVKEGDFRPGRNGVETGWRGSGFGSHIWGALTIQGLLGYYYHEHNSNNVELNRCKINQIADNPRASTYRVNGRLLPHVDSPLHPANATWTDTTCKDNRPNCNDVQCQNYPLEETYLLHYTKCKLPMLCKKHCKPDECEWLSEPTCAQMHKLWFRTRRSFENHYHPGRPAPKTTFQGHINLGYCSSEGAYLPIERNQR